ncbi:TPA: Fic family protein [Mannheimia haemolytica]
MLYKNLLDKLDNYKNILDEYRPLNQKVLQQIEQDFLVKYNQQSNAIEGNSLTIFETRVLLESGITANGKPFKDHLDILNHQEAIYYLNDLVKERKILSEAIIKDFHYLLLQKTDNAREAGKYRTMPVVIQGAEHLPPQPYLIASKMEELIEWNNKQQLLHPIERIAQLHNRFVGIHPFIDGNGRTGRLIMNFELLKSGYQIAIIKAEQRADYYQALQLGDQGNYVMLTQVIAEAAIATMEHTLKIIDFIE